MGVSKYTHVPDVILVSGVTFTGWLMVGGRSVLIQT